METIDSWFDELTKLYYSITENDKVDKANMVILDAIEQLNKIKGE